MYWGFMKMILIPAIYSTWLKLNVDDNLNYFTLTLMGYSLIFIHLKDLFEIVTNKMMDYNYIKVYGSLLL
jgi:hypothetical protein